MLFLILNAVNSWGWWDQSTHRIMSQYAAKQYFTQNISADFLDQALVIDGKKQPAETWLQDGSQFEDAGELYQYPLGIVRSLNHFHDPTKPLASAGLTDLPISSLYGESTVLWAQDGANQSTKVGGDWSWKKVRDYQIAYLTATSKIDEDANLARTLMGLGYQMHLVQDMSQPNHVRNDTHVFDGAGYQTANGFETWAKNLDATVVLILNSDDAKQIINNTAVDLKPAYEGGLSPVARLYDTRDTPGPFLLPSTSFSQGLAEYTNTNFFSEDTMFADRRFDVTDKYYFGYPSKSETDVQMFIDNN